MRTTQRRWRYSHRAIGYAVDSFTGRTPVKGYRCAIPGWRPFAFAVQRRFRHEQPGGWAVTELSTGLRLGTGTTRPAAMRESLRILRKALGTGERAHNRLRRVIRKQRKALGTPRDFNKAAREVPFA